MDLIKTIKTAYNSIYVYKENNKLFVFKPSKSIEKEILANKLAKILGIKTVETEPFEIDGMKGIKMDFKTKEKILTYYKNNLNKYQIKELKRIIFFDMWIGNKDRHTANIFINRHLICFDHENIFNEGKARRFIKLDLGRRLRKDFVDIIEKVIGKKLSAKQVLMKLGFNENDFPKIDKKAVEMVVKDRKILDFLCSRTDFNKLEF